MIHLAEKNQCTGCAACYNSCPKSAISMRPDNGGFLYPYINDELCIKCNQCSKSCPVISPLISKSEYEPRAFVAQHKDDDIRKESTSGGAFTALAQVVIENGGVVFGASMEDGFVVKHTPATTIDELAKFRNSKYVQSEIGKSFSAVKEYLEKGIQVLFSGTPCQIEGLLGYLHEKYNNLITVDIVCHSIPSPAVFKKYMDYKSTTVGNISNVRFRSKNRGYSFPTMLIEGTKNEKQIKYESGSEWDEYLRLFLKRYSTRSCCDTCTFQNIDRKSDITIWDCNNIYERHNDYDDDKGTSNVLVRTINGRKIFETASNKLKTQNIDFSTIYNEFQRKNYKSCVPNEFYVDLYNLTGAAFFGKYTPCNIKRKILHYGRVLSYKIGIYRPLIRIFRISNRKK